MVRAVSEKPQPVQTRSPLASSLALRGSLSPSLNGGEGRGEEVLPVVFLPAMEDDSLPHYYALEEGKEAVEEERRLLYVAITRAKARLLLSSCTSRHRHDRRPSRFLSGLEGEGLLVRH